MYLALKKFVRKHIFPRPYLPHLPFEKRKALLEKSYNIHLNTKIDWDNPVLFTDKLQWMKLYYNHPDLLRCVDKFLFKQYIQEKLGDGYTARLIQVWHSPEEVSIRSISENKFVVKSNLQSDGKMVVPVSDKNELDIDKLEEDIKKNWFNPKNLLTNSYCSAYHGGKPCVIVEEFVEEFANTANDYKIFCFAGEPAFAYVAEEHFVNGITTKTHPITLYDLDWKMMDVAYGSHEQNPNVPKPPHFDQMLEISKILSKEFPFVRVDFFDTAEKLYLAELTFYPGGGMTPYHPESFNREMGDKLKLPVITK